MIDEKLIEESEQLIRNASSDLEEMYSNIKKSKKMMKFKDHGELYGEIQISIIAFFSFMQLMEFSTKSKMISNSTGKELNQRERLIQSVGCFKSKFESFVNQYLSQIGKN